MPACGICTAENLTELEELGRRAQQGEISWRQAARDGGQKYHQSLQNHMETHFVARETTVAKDELDALIAGAITDLTHEMASAPAVSKPLYLVAIQNLRELRETKPSQQHLIQALKTIQDISGMRQEQRFLLQFTEAMFREVEQPRPRPELVSATVVDAEVVE